jgi:tRNA modification GTPase
VKRAPPASDTIAAIATAPGPSGIGVVRVSGPESLAVADLLFMSSGSGAARRPSACPGGTFMHGYVKRIEDAVEPAGRDEAPADEVVLLIYRAPHSYTREDAIEIQTHGGRLPARRVLRQVLTCGASPAEPGEFTRRAFLNGRIDLTQAEAVMDLINAESDRAASSAIRQIRGDISNSIIKIYDDMTSSLAYIEATLDFPDDEVPQSVLTIARQCIAQAVADTERLLGTWYEGRVLREGTHVVIAGRPNVGKSTLLNAILKAERAIVSDVPGTTRDTIEETVIVSGFPVHLVDTAGLRDAECQVERHGVRRSQEMIRGADVVLYVLDSSAPLAEEDRRMIDDLRMAQSQRSKEPEDRSTKILLVLNKVDRGRELGPGDFAGIECVECSLLEPTGVAPVTGALEAILGSVAEGPPHAVISERHYRTLSVAADHLRAAAAVMETGSDEAPALAAVHLRSGLDQLGRLLGKDYTSDLLDEVFSRFCIGK